MNAAQYRDKATLVCMSACACYFSELAHLTSTEWMSQKSRSSKVYGELVVLGSIYYFTSIATFVLVATIPVRSH